VVVGVGDGVGIGEGLMAGLQGGGGGRLAAGAVVLLLLLLLLLHLLLLLLVMVVVKTVAKLKFSCGNLILFSKKIVNIEIQIGIKIESWSRIRTVIKTLLIYDNNRIL
jgi:hypothetical protein